MYVPKYLKILEEEQIQESELTPELIREIKGLKLQVNLCKNLSNEDARYRSMLEKDDKLCAMINDWLDEELPPAQEPPAQEPPAQEPPAQEPPAQEPPAQEPPAINPDAEKISAIKAKLQKNRIHVNDLTQILGAKPDFPYHQLNGMKLERVFMNSQFYQLK